MDIVPIRNLVEKLIDNRIGPDIDPDTLKSLVEDIAVHWYDDAVRQYNEGYGAGLSAGFHM